MIIVDPAQLLQNPGVSGSVNAVQDPAKSNEAGGQAIRKKFSEYMLGEAGASEVDTSGQIVTEPITLALDKVKNWKNLPDSQLSGDLSTEIFADSSDSQLTINQPDLLPSAVAAQHLDPENQGGEKNLSDDLHESSAVSQIRVYRNITTAEDTKLTAAEAAKDELKVKTREDILISLGYEDDSNEADQLIIIEEINNKPQPQAVNTSVVVNTNTGENKFTSTSPDSKYSTTPGPEMISVEIDPRVISSGQTSLISSELQKIKVIQGRSDSELKVLASGELIANSSKQNLDIDLMLGDTKPIAADNSSISPILIKPSLSAPSLSINQDVTKSLQAGLVTEAKGLDNVQKNHLKINELQSPDEISFKSQSDQFSLLADVDLIKNKIIFDESKPLQNSGFRSDVLPAELNKDIKLSESQHYEGFKALEKNNVKNIDVYKDVVEEKAKAELLRPEKTEVLISQSPFQTGISDAKVKDLNTKVSELGNEANRIDHSAQKIPFGDLKVELVKLLNQGGGGMVVRVTPPDSGEFSIDLRLGVQGQASLNIIGISSELKERFSETSGALKDTFSQMGLQLDLQFSEGSPRQEGGPQNGLAQQEKLATDTSRDSVNSASEENHKSRLGVGDKTDALVSFYA